MAKTPEGYYDPADYTMVHKRFLARGCDLCGTDKNTFVCAGCSARFEASLLEILIKEITDDGYETSDGVIAMLDERLARCKQRSAQPLSADAVDPHVADPGKLTTRA